MLETIVVILLIFWLLGVLGGGRYGIPNVGGLIHILLVIILVILLLRLL